MTHNSSSSRRSSFSNLGQTISGDGSGNGREPLSEAALAALDKKRKGRKHPDLPLLVPANSKNRTPNQEDILHKSSSSSSKNRSSSLQVDKKSTSKNSRRGNQATSLPPLREEEPKWLENSGVIDLSALDDEDPKKLDLSTIDLNNLTEEQIKALDMTEKVLIKTYPYPVVKGIPTYQTDYSAFGTPMLTEEEVQRLEKGVSLPKLDKTRNSSPKNPRAQKEKKTADGKPVKRPPLSRATSVGDLEEVYFQGPNFNGQLAHRKKYRKKGLRLSKCYDNVASFGGSSWQTNNANYGSVVKPSVLHQKRSGLISFELLRFLPDHPHWKDRPFIPDENGHIQSKTQKSTYMDLGSYYINGKHLPTEFRYCQAGRIHHENEMLF